MVYNPVRPELVEGPFCFAYVASRAVLTGYLGDADKTAAAFDDEGYNRTGDLATFHDRADPGRGLAFAGRMAEEFKLSNGTWVYGGQLRDSLLKALADEVSELVLADDGAPFLGLLVWAKAGATLDSIAIRLAAFNRGQRGESATIRRVALLAGPPSVDAHEISDKGTINRRAVLDHRTAAVAALFAAVPGETVRAL